MATTVDDTSAKKEIAKHVRGEGTVAEKRHAKVKPGALGNYKVPFGNLLDSLPTYGSTNLLDITTRISNLDTLAEQALAKVKAEFYATPQKAEQVLEKVTEKGWATELMAVTKRLNRLQISENKRLVLAAVYPAILFDLLGCEDGYEEQSERRSKGSDKQIKEALEDTVGFANGVICKLEESAGALDLFAEKIVEGVCEKNRIDFSEEEHLRDLIVYQVRAGL